MSAEFQATSLLQAPISFSRSLCFGHFKGSQGSKVIWIDNVIYLKFCFSRYQNVRIKEIGCIESRMERELASVQSLEYIPGIKLLALLHHYTILWFGNCVNLFVDKETETQ